ncbi:MAG: hypothetical protein AAF716_03135 [Cyanobacteria bacterium P01_D01_bin.1]
MNGSSPPPPPPRPPFAKPPKPPRSVRRRPAQLPTPWAQLALLCFLYVGIGLVLALPEPPAWVWLSVAIAIPLLALGLTPALHPVKKKHRTGGLAYLGGLFLVVGLSVALNYLGSEQNFDTLGFSAAVLGLGVLILGSVLLAGVTAFVTAQACARLMASGQYWRSAMIVVVTCLTGLCMGGLAGLSLVVLPA